MGISAAAGPRGTQGLHHCGARDLHPVAAGGSAGRHLLTSRPPVHISGRQACMLAIAGMPPGAKPCCQHPLAALQSENWG